MLRNIDDPNEAFTRVEFASVEDAKEFRDPSCCFPRA
jgi:hypothetical protein